MMIGSGGTLDFMHQLYCFDAPVVFLVTEMIARPCECLDVRDDPTYS